MRVVALAALAAYRLLLHGPPYQGPRCTSPAPRPIALACATTVLSSLLVEAFAPIVTVQRIPARSSPQSNPSNSYGGDNDVRHGAIDAAAVVSVDGDGDDGDGDDGDGGKKMEGATDVTDIESMIPDSVVTGVMESSKEEYDDDDADVDAEAAVEATADAKDEDGDATQEARPTPATKVRASASAAALREASERRRAAETKRAAALQSAAAKEEDRQLAALTEQRLAAAAAAAIADERRRQASIVEERREAKRRAIEEETQRAMREQSRSQAEKSRRFRREAAAAFGGKNDNANKDRGGEDGVVTPRQAYAREERSAQRRAEEEVLFSANQQSRRDDLSRVEANRRADAALPVEVIGASGVASEQRRLEEDMPYPPLRPPRPGGRETDDDRSPGFVGFSNARARYPQRSKWVRKLQADMLGKPPPPMDLVEEEDTEAMGVVYGGGPEGKNAPPGYDDYQPIDVGGGGGGRASDDGRGGMPASPTLAPKEEEKTKPKGNRVLTPRAPYPSSSSSSSSSSAPPPSTTPSPGRVPATPVNLERFGDAWFQEQLRASQDEQGGEVHWYEGRRKQMVREEQERRERKEALEAAMERERSERLEREAREDAEADELEKTEATAQSISIAEEDSQADEEERKQRERIAAVLEVDEVRAELEKEREAIKAELEKKRAEATAAREAKLERERRAQEAAAKVVEEKIKAAEEEIAAVEDQVQESAPAVASDTSTSSGAEKDDSPEEEQEEEEDNGALALAEDRVETEIESEANHDDKVSKDLEEEDVPPISIDDSFSDTEGEAYNTYKAETIERRLASLQKDVAKSSEMVEEMSTEVSDLEEEYAHASKMLRRAQDRKNEKLIRIRSDDAAYVKAQLIDMSQELDILQRELACKEELLQIYEKRSGMLKREEWSEGRGPIKSLPLTEWNHREEKEW